MTEAELRLRLRVAVAGYEAHREHPVSEQDETASWWYSAWAASVVPLLREVLAADAGGSHP